MAGLYIGVLDKIKIRFSRVIIPTFNWVFKQVFGPQNLHLFICFKVFGKLKKSFETSSFNFYIIQEVFPSIFFCASLSKYLFSHKLELFIVKSISRVLYGERCYLWSLWSPSVVKLFSLLGALTLCLPSCIEDWSLYPLWSSLVEIVEIFHTVKAGT